MTEQQFKLADLILRYMADEPMSNKSTLSEEFTYKQGFSYNDFHMVLGELQRRKLFTPFPGKQYSFTLSDEGMKVAGIGFKQYIKENIKDAEFKIQRDEKAYKVNIATLIVAIVSLLIGLLSLLIELL